MRFARALIGCTCLASLVLVTGDGLQSQEKKEAPKGVRQLPSNWTKLDLTPTQKEEIYKLNAEYKVKKDKLAEEMRALDAELAKKRSGVLTGEQKKKLAELVGVETTDPKEKPKEKAKDKGKE